jgi:uncharacterized cupredoxin-like copper-binding protein
MPSGTPGRRSRGLQGLLAFGVSAVLLAGCSAAAPSPPSAAASAQAGTTVNADLSEFKIALSAPTGPAGAVTFALKNSGTTVHEFVVFKTDLAPDKLPLSADGLTVDEEGATDLTLVDEVEDIEVGASATLAVDLPAAHYVLICNLPAHYTSGMHTEFTTN